MNVLVTGATGFIGNYVVKELLGKGHSVTVVARDQNKIKKFQWVNDVRFIVFDIHAPNADPVYTIGVPDIVIHLAWSNLIDYKSLAHIEETLPANYHFLSTMARAGVKHFVVAGTCFEYGLQCGCLDEDSPACPVLPYAIAKDSLRRFMEALQNENSFCLQWARIFYPYGDGQKTNSLLSQLNTALDQGEEVFHMSGGEQLRDYLPVEEVAADLVTIAENPTFAGIVNICSGKPISVRRFVEEYLARRNATIRLNLGHYPYSSHEPIAFWGNSEKMRLLKNVCPKTN